MKKKHKGLQIAVLVFVCVILAGLCAVGYYLYKQVNSGLFFEETTLNGYDVSGMSCREVLSMLVEDYSAPTLTILESDEAELTLTLEEMGYTINETELLTEIQSCMREQNLSLIFSLAEGNDFEVEVSFDFDENVFATAVSSANFTTARITCSDASLQYDGTEYYIEPEIYGTEFDDADLQVMVKDYVDNLVAEDRPQEDGTIEIPDSFYYLPAVTQDDFEMNTLMDIYNSYCQTVITLTFGDDEDDQIVLDWSTIQEWLVIDGEIATIDEQQVEDFVYNLAATYNTLYLPRTFTTTNGATIEYDSSDYGYQIDQSGEIAQILADIEANTAVTREPTYSTKGRTRDGVDDICGTYVEVDLTGQHLWYYKNGELIIESDIVSGLPTEERETATGVFMIPYKQTDVTLSGGTGSSAWETDVTYWMPFHDGQGLHDATWRSSFGGTIYQTNGSHGCVNLPYNVAETIYNEMEERTPIFLYKTE
ncbi:MAG: L,D-transpeptidase/peptidoglycan binding protein [Lachnospiraceae bacterium]|nr:L,D-transpeptidase/peptidoglycan binding protein [Lachnospiraceae bacterium]